MDVKELGSYLTLSFDQSPGLTSGSNDRARCSNHAAGSTWPWKLSLGLYKSLRGMFLKCIPLQRSHFVKWHLLSLFHLRHLLNVTVRFLELPSCPVSLPSACDLLWLSVFLMRHVRIALALQSYNGGMVLARSRGSCCLCYLYQRTITQGGCVIKVLLAIWFLSLHKLYMVSRLWKHSITFLHQTGNL